MYVSVNWQTECYLHLSWAPEAAMQPQAMPLPPPRLTEKSCMLWITSRFFLSPHFVLSITSAEVHFASTTFEPFLCISQWILIRSSDIYCSWEVFIFCMWPLYCFCLSFFQTVDCNTFTPALWRFLVMSPTVFFLFTDLAMWTNLADLFDVWLLVHRRGFLPQNNSNSCSCMPQACAKTPW